MPTAVVMKAPRIITRKESNLLKKKLRAQGVKRISIHEDRVFMLCISYNYLIENDLYLVLYSVLTRPTITEFKSSFPFPYPSHILIRDYCLMKMVDAKIESSRNRGA